MTPVKRYLFPEADAGQTHLESAYRLDGRDVMDHMEEEGAAGGPAVEAEAKERLQEGALPA